jgi:hypothetical protein
MSDEAKPTDELREQLVAIERRYEATQRRREEVDAAAASSRRCVERLALQLVAMRAHAAQASHFEKDNAKQARQAHIAAVEHSMNLYLEDIANPPAVLSEGLPGNGRQIGKSMSRDERIALHEKHREKREVAISAALATCSGK